MSAVTQSANSLRQDRLLLDEDQKSYIIAATNGGIGFRTAAVAGPKNATAITRQFQLDGTACTSFDGKPLSYQWTITPGSPGAAILGGDTATPTVQFSIARGAYTFQLTVTDSTGKTAVDLVTINFFGI